jgi:hypothetical protein
MHSWSALLCQYVEDADIRMDFDVGVWRAGNCSVISVTWFSYKHSSVSWTYSSTMYLAQVQCFGHTPFCGGLTVYQGTMTVGGEEKKMHFWHPMGNKGAERQIKEEGK